MALYSSDKSRKGVGSDRIKSKILRLPDLSHQIRRAQDDKLDLKSLSSLSIKGVL